jgi:hypothetical protein
MLVNLSSNGFGAAQMVLVPSHIFLNDFWTSLHGLGLISDSASKATFLGPLNLQLISAFLFVSKSSLPLNSS